LRSINQYIPWIVGAAVCLIVALVYRTTLQTDINGLDDLVDVGEFQNALFLWGIAHPTGYPLYLLVGGAFVHLLYYIGVNPAEGASLFSLAGGLATLAVVFAIMHMQTKRTIFAVVFTAMLAADGAFWLQSIDAEVYSWTFFFIALAVYLALMFRSRPRPFLLLALLFVLGTGIAHHRLVAFAVPAILFPISPEIWQLIRTKARLAALGVGALILPFGVYVYLPLRAHFGTKWEFAPADTWDGFLTLFTGRGYVEGAVSIPTDAGTWMARVSSVVGLLAGQLTPVGLALCVAAVGALWAIPGQRRVAALVSLGAATFFLFELIFPIKNSDAYLVPATILLLLAAAVAIAEWSRRWASLPILTAPLVLCLALFLGFQTYPGAYQLGSDLSGRELLDAVAPLSGPQVVLVGPWGPDFFDFWYGKYVTGEIAPGTQVVTPDAPIRRYLNQGLRLYASKDIFYSVPLAMWDRKLGNTFIQSVGRNVVEVSNRPITQPALASGSGAATFGSVVTLVRDQTSFDPARSVLSLTLYWRAEERIRTDYSVMVHLVDRTEGDRIVAQADGANPVYGFYPTSRWQKGEIVRDDYEVAVSRDVPVEHDDLIVGWYRADPETSGFQNLGTFRISPLPLTPGK
jgi:Protein O-mannosyl-transferase TMEM260-like